MGAMHPTGAETIDVPRDTIEVAHRELGILIDETTPSTDSGTAMTPLAALKHRVATQLSVADTGTPAAAAYQDVLDAIEELAADRGVERVPCDPLQDDIFRTYATLESALAPSSAAPPAGGD